MPSISLAARLLPFTLWSAVLVAPVLADDPTVSASLSQPIYEIGETVELTITGPPGGWTFLIFSSRLEPTVIPGIGTFEVGFDPLPVVLDLGMLPPSGALVLEDASLCSRIFVANQPIHVEVAVLPLGGPLPLCTSGAVQIISANGDGCPRCVDEPVADPNVTAASGGVALELPDTGGAFVLAPSSQFSEYKDGTARLAALLCSTDDPESGYCAEFAFGDRLDQGSVAFPPLGAPKLEFFPSTYFLNGGPIDPDGWHYYTAFEATLTGFGALTGAVIELVGDGRAQVGLGADGRNLDYGLCVGVAASVVAQPDTGPGLADSAGAMLRLSQTTCPEPVEARIRGTVFYDIDGDGLYDPLVPGEVPLAGWRVELETAGVDDVVFTDADGRYEFVRPAYTVHALDSIAPEPGYTGVPGGRWAPTTPIGYAKLAAKPDEIVRDFGVLSMIPTPQLSTSKGYWHNQGESELLACEPLWRSLVNDLCLRLNETVPFPPPPVDPTIFTVSTSDPFGPTFDELSDYLVSPAKGVLASTLSKHYCAGVLNANCGPGASTVVNVLVADDVLANFDTLAANTLALLCDPKSCDTGPGGDSEWRETIAGCLNEWSGFGSGEGYFSRDEMPRTFDTPYDAPVDSGGGPGTGSDV